MLDFILTDNIGNQLFPGDIVKEVETFWSSHKVRVNPDIGLVIQILDKSHLIVFWARRRVTAKFPAIMSMKLNAT